MRYLTTVKLLAAVLFLALSVWIIENGMDANVADRRIPFEGVRLEDVDYILIENGTLRMECSKKDRGWFLEYPVKARADEALINQLLSEMETMNASEVITERQREERDLDLADYGLDNPGARIKFGSRYFTKELDFGLSAPVGDAVYVKFRDETEVYAVDGSVSNLVPRDVSSLRDARIMPGDPAKVCRLEIHRPGGFVQLIRQRSGWWIQQPFSAPADGAVVDRLLEKLFKLKALQYVWDPPAESSGHEIIQDTTMQDLYGFSDDVSPARISVWMTGEELAREVVFGREIPDQPGMVYARRRTFETIFAVPVENAPLAGTGADDLRDRLIFPFEPARVREVGFEQGDARLVLHRRDDSGWMITDPVNWQADDDVVRQLVSALTRIKVAGYAGVGSGFNEGEDPDFRISVATGMCQSVNAAGPPEARDEFKRCSIEMVSFGRPDSNGIRRVSFPNGQYAFMSKDALSSVDPVKLTDPLQYRDRTVMSLASKNVRRIEIERGGVKEAAARSAEGQWVALSDSNAIVNMNNVNDLLLCAANLRAAGFESLNPKSLKAYGLEPPAVTVTFGLMGDEGIRKSLMLGFRSGNDGVYGLIQGQDLLLIFDKRNVELMTRSLTEAVTGNDHQDALQPSSAGERK